MAQTLCYSIIIFKLGPYIKNNFYKFCGAIIQGFLELLSHRIAVEQFKDCKFAVYHDRLIVIVSIMTLVTHNYILNLT